MKTILAVTDFSEAGINATQYAFRLAQAFTARLLIYSAYQQVPVVLPEEPMLVTPEDMREYVHNHLEQQKLSLAGDKPVQVDTLCTEDHPVAGIVSTAKENHADLIVAGMKTVGKGLRKLFGSTVTALINKLPVPLLVIPEDRQYAFIDSIALANESDLPAESDIHLLDTLHDLALRFQSHIYLVRVFNNEIRESFGILYGPSRIKNALKDLRPDYATTLGKTVTDGLTNFVKEHQIDVLALFSHKHSLLSRWMGDSVTHKMLFDMAVPLLIVPVTERGRRFREFSNDIIL